MGLRELAFYHCVRQFVVVYGRMSQLLLIGFTILIASDFTFGQPPEKNDQIEQAGNLFGTAPVRAKEEKPKKQRVLEEGDKRGAEDEDDNSAQRNVLNANAKTDPSGNEALNPEDSDDHEHQNENADSPEERALMVELSFVRRACQLTDEQEEAIARQFDKKWLAKQKSGFRLVNGIGVGGDEVQSSARSTRDRIIRLIAKPLKEILTPEQWERYEAEQKARKEFEFEARRDCIVMLLNRQLRLTESQIESLRSIIGRSLTIENVEDYMNNPQYLPTLPDAAITKILSPKQAKMYHSIQKVTFGNSEHELLPVVRK